jgi:ribosome biogenesis protein NSA2
VRGSAFSHLFKMPQNEYIELFQKRFGKKLDHEERSRKKQARDAHKSAQVAQKLRGIKAKIHNRKKFVEKVQMKKNIKMHEERNSQHKSNDDANLHSNAVPAYLMDREGVSRAKILSNTVKQKRKDKAGKWSVPIPKVKAIADDEMFKALRSGKRRNKQWKRVVNKVTFVGPNFTRKPPKYERFIRPSALRFKKAHVTHPELQTTFNLDIIAVKKNPSSALYTQLGVITKGTIIEVNVSDLGLVTTSGKVVWGKYAQVTNNPEIDGCINAVLLV